MHIQDTLFLNETKSGGGGDSDGDTRRKTTRVSALQLYFYFLCLSGSHCWACRFIPAPFIPDQSVIEKRDI